MQYGDKLMEHFENPRNVGSFDDDEPNVGTGMIGSPACGDVMKLQIKVDPKTEIIVDVRFKTFGCGSAIASSSLLTEWVKGKTLDEAMEIRNRDIAKELELPPIKVHCSVLAQDALEAAIGDFRKRLSGEKRPDEAPEEVDVSCGVGPGECHHLTGDSSKCDERCT